MKQSYESTKIPKELREINQWLCWGEKCCPISPVGGGLTKWCNLHNPFYWCSYDQCNEAYLQNNCCLGIGFLFENDEFIFIDLDHCFSNGNLTPEAEIISSAFLSYQQISQSGTGLHIFCEGNKITSDCTGMIGKQKIEVYSDRRFCRMTGNQYGGFSTIENCQEEIETMWDWWFPKIEITKGCDRTGVVCADDIWQYLKHEEKTKCGKGRCNELHAVVARRLMHGYALSIEEALPFYQWWVEQGEHTYTLANMRDALDRGRKADWPFGEGSMIRAETQLCEVDVCDVMKVEILLGENNETNKLV